MLLLLLLIFASVLQSKKVSIDGPCLTGLRAESTKFLGKSGIAGLRSQILDDCHRFVPDRENLITAFATQTDCYFARESFFQSVQGINFNRCGICVEVIGPTLKRATCTLVGSVVMNFTNPLTMVEDINTYARTVFLNDQLYKFLGGYGTDGETGNTFPIAVHSVNCPFKTVPSAMVTSIVDDGKGGKNAAISVFNTNQITSGIELLGKFYQFDEYLQFIVPVTDIPKGTFLKVHNVFGGHVNIPFMFTVNKTLSSSTVPLDYFKPQECSLIINEGTTLREENDDPLMVWTLRMHDVNNISNSHIITDLKNIEIDTEVRISMTFPYPIIISKHFKSFRVVFDSTVLIEPNQEISLYTFVNGVTNLKEFKCSKDFVFDRNVSQTANGLHVESAFSLNMARCYSQVNMMMMHYKLKGKGVLSVSSISFKQLYTRNFTNCSTTAFACGERDQCDPTNSEVEDVSGIEVRYQSGCVPYCGVCKSDEVCSKAARCVKRTTKNTRDGVFGVFIMSILCILFCI
ncbi:hypothetical protein EIN_184340 [Entamoeba invadens IP1]|uniref:hypothetical protein n=1 Tax=Entamoeba invadens IP1 TaxID=370355 RepID=UPI0002C3EB9C|nr:hypothetical protein EIN_184340 [Entamoeba invadens IP1]ELP94087.1 hypothetical protein EIN_184340 [Entamoeba invadens IP1]|eukprot:XP_004260858.1 hypothetical protein EIN_184340 [Entamoeba invadens IP1]